MNTQLKILLSQPLALAALMFNLSLIQPAKAQSFLLTGSLNTNRLGHTATLLSNGKVLVAGGYNETMGYLASAELYDPATGTWTTTGAMKTILKSGINMATLLPNGKVLVAGGENPSGDILFSAELYDPATGNWTFTGSMKTNHYLHTTTLLPNGKVLLAGGYINSGGSASAELYDPATGRWAATGAMKVFHIDHTATLLTNGNVLVAGGCCTQSIAAELYIPATGTWTETGPMNRQRTGHTSTLLPNGKVLAVGGWGDSGVTNSAELYDPASGTWAETGAMTTNRVMHTATLLPNGKVLVAGGLRADGTSSFAWLSSAELFDPATETWTEIVAMDITRAYHSSTLLPNGQVLVAGGNGDYYYHALFSAELYYSATGTVTVLSTPAKLPNGAFQFAFTNTPGATLTVLATTNLSLSVSNWTLLGWATEISSGHFQFTDSQATNGGQRFYRVRWP